MNREEKEEIEGMFRQALIDHVYIDAEQHRDDHEWIKKRRETHERRALAIESTKNSLIDWGIKGVIASILAVTWYALRHWTH